MELCTDYYVNLNLILLHKANIVLQKLFLNQWQKSTKEAWKNSAEQGKAFITGKGKKVWQTSSRRQKELLEVGNVDLWDLKLCSHILQKLDLKVKFKNKEKEKFAELVAIQNEINRNYNETLISKSPSEWPMNKTQYETLWVKIASILTYFGEIIPSFENFDANSKSENSADAKYLAKVKIATSIIESPIEDSDPVNTQEAVTLKEMANTFFNERKYKEAINTYTQAIELSGMSKELRSILYSNRSAVFSIQKIDEHIKFHKFEKPHDMALNDARKAVQLNPTWFRAHYRLATAYNEMGKFYKAVRHYNITLSLDKSRLDFVKIRDECKLKIPEISPALLYLEGLKKDVEAADTGLKERSGGKMSFKNMQKFFPDSSTSIKGVQHLVGFQTPQNHELAVTLFQKAAKKKDAQALYQLGMLHRFGIAVQKNLQKSMNYFKEAVQQKPNEAMPLAEESVSEAEAELAFIYDKGWGTCNDLEKALAWYQKSSDHGNKTAPFGLAQFYMNGRGVEKDEVKAEQYLKLAASRFNVDAMYVLAQYYLFKAEDPNEAVKWHERAVSSGNISAISNANEFLIQVKNLKTRSKEIDKELIDWELKCGLPTTGITMLERRRRFIERKTPGIGNFCNDMQDINQKFTKIKLPAKLEKGMKYKLEDLDYFVKKGSVVAAKIRDALLSYNKAVYLLDQDKPDVICEIISLFADSIRKSELVVDIWDVCRALNTFIQLHPERQEIPVPSQQDIDLRVCEVSAFGNDIQKACSFLKECVKLYPNEEFFHDLLCCMYGFLADPHRGLAAANKALKKFPNNVDILYVKAAFMRQSKTERENSIAIVETYERFLSLASKDHRRVPASYYSLAYMHLSRKDMFKVMDYYKRGLDAEKNQLPYFLPVECAEKSTLDSLSQLQAFSVLQLAKDEPTPRKNTPDTLKSEDEMKFSKLLEPRRVELIVAQRKVAARSKGLQTSLYKSNISVQPKLTQTGPSQLAEVKTILLEEMGPPTANHIYEGFGLSCVVVDEPILGFSAIHVLVEDENLDVERLGVYNIPQDENTDNLLGYGCRLTVLNPYYKKGELDGKLYIRVDEPESIIFEGRDVNRCRFCGKSRAALQCSKCHRATYCNRECQVQDWKVMKHKFICF